MKPPWHLWAIGIVSLLWNAGGAFDYYMTMTRNDAYMGEFTPQQLDYFYSFPTWVVAFWALGVWLAVAGSILLLARSGMALWAFLLSLVGMVGTTIYTFALADTSMAEVVGPAAMAFSAVIFVVGVFLIWYARRQKINGVLH